VVALLGSRRSRQLGLRFRFLFNFETRVCLFSLFSFLFSFSLFLHTSSLFSSLSGFSPSFNFLFSRAYIYLLETPRLYIQDLKPSLTTIPLFRVSVLFSPLVFPFLSLCCFSIDT